MKKVKAERDFGYGPTAIKKGDVVEVPKEAAEIFENNKLVKATDDKVTLNLKTSPDVDEKEVGVEILKPFGFKGIGLTPGDTIEVLERIALSWQGDKLAKIVKKKPAKKQDTPKNKMETGGKNK